MLKNTRIAMAGLLLMASTGVPARACTDPPPMTSLTAIIITVGPPVVVTLVFDPWTTFETDTNKSCACAFRFPTAMIETIDDVRLVETGTDTPIPGFSWAPNTTTSDAVEALSGAGAGNGWLGFLSGISENVEAGIEADFQVDITLKASVTKKDLITALDEDGNSRVFTDEGNSDGTLTGNHAGFVDVEVALVPTVSEWGLVAMVLLTLTAGTVVLGRRRRRVATA